MPYRRARPLCGAPVCPVGQLYNAASKPRPSGCHLERLPLARLHLFCRKFRHHKFDSLGACASSSLPAIRQLVRRRLKLLVACAPRRINSLYKLLRNTLNRIKGFAYLCNVLAACHCTVGLAAACTACDFCGFTNYISGVSALCNCVFAACARK